MLNKPILLTFQRRYTSSAIEDILLGQSKYICSENSVFLIRGLSLEFGEKNPYNICLTSADKQLRSRLSVSCVFLAVFDDFVWSIQKKAVLLKRKTYKLTKRISTS